MMVIKACSMAGTSIYQAGNAKSERNKRNQAI